MVRKAALVGCPKGSWIRTAGIRRLVLNANVRQDTMLKVSQSRDNSLSEKVFVGPGKHALDDADWTMVSIAEGHHIDALCVLEGAA